jgi:hypothetical protein
MFNCIVSFCIITLVFIPENTKNILKGRSHNLLVLFVFVSDVQDGHFFLQAD